MSNNKNATKPSTITHSMWWKNEITKTPKGATLDFLHSNFHRLESTLESIYHRSLLYRITNVLLSSFTYTADLVDRLLRKIILNALKLPAPKKVKEAIRIALFSLSFGNIAKFISVKFYAFKKAPQNSQVVQILDEVISFVKQDGFEVKHFYPSFIRKFSNRKQHLLQHSFYKEFTKSNLEKLLAVPFSFNRSILPVLSDNTLLHKIFVYLENYFMIDMILVDKKGVQVSALFDDKKRVSASDVIKTLDQVSSLKKSGKRIFIVGHHEGYVGPYFVRTLLRRLGYDDLAARCNTTIGPRMISNIVLKTISSNVGNLFLVLPSQKTKPINEKSLANALVANSKRTQQLIKMPDSGLDQIATMSHKVFMKTFIHSDHYTFNRFMMQHPFETRTELNIYFNKVRAQGIFDELGSSDYEMFKKVMREPFLIFPEGTRSHIDHKGNVIMKYINPKYMEAYMRPGDIIFPVSLVGGAEAIKGIRLNASTAGFSCAEPYEVRSEMIENYEIEGLEVMRKIADLPNIKSVIFDDEIQAGKQFKASR